MKHLKKKGQAAAGMAITIATMAIVLVVVVIVVGNLTANLTVPAGSATAAYNNVTYYTWQGLTLVAIGIILVAGMGLIYMLTRGR